MVYTTNHNTKVSLGLIAIITIAVVVIKTPYRHKSKNHNNEIVEFTTSTEIPGAPSNLWNPELLQSKVAQSNPQPHITPYIDHHYQEHHQDVHDHDQVTAINNINAMLAQATSSIRNENEAVHNLQGRPSLFTLDRVEDGKNSEWLKFPICLPVSISGTAGSYRVITWRRALISGHFWVVFLTKAKVIQI